MEESHIISIQVGLPRWIRSEEPEKLWFSGIFKEPVKGPVWLGKINLSGDGQADLEVHGGPDKAVLAYAACHYPFWSKELGLDISHGAFGENFTIDGLDETKICIGDTYAVGEALVQITQPRQPCWKLSHRLGIKDLVERVHTSGRTGWYFRVLKEGYVEKGLPITLIERPFPEWTISSAYEVRFSLKAGLESILSLANCPLLSQRWRTGLLNKSQSIKSGGKINKGG